MSYSQNEDTDFESASSTTVDTSQRTSDDDTLKDVDARLSDSKGPHIVIETSSTTIVKETDHQHAAVRSRSFGTGIDSLTFKPRKLEKGPKRADDPVQTMSTLVAIKTTSEDFCQLCSICKDLRPVVTEKRPDVYLAAKLEAEADLIEEELLEGLKASELRRKRLGKRKKTCLETVCPQCFRALEVIDEEYFREDIELGRRRQERVDRLRKLAEDIRSTATDEERRKKLIDDYRLESERDKSDLRATKSRSFLADLYGDLDSESLQNLLKDRDKYELETERGRQLLESDEKALQKRKTPKFIREEEPLLADKKVSELVKHLAREKFLNPEQIEKLKEYRKQFRDGKITQAEFENQLEDLLKASKGGPEAERKLSRILEELDDRKDQDIQEDFQLRDRLIDFLKRVDKEFGQEFDEDYERDIRKQIRLAGYDKEDLFGTPEERKQRLLAQLRREEIESELDLTRRKHLEDLLRQIQFEKERRAVRRRKIRLELSKRLDDPLEDAKRRGRLNELLKREDEQSDVETDREKRYLDLLKKAHIDSEERKRRKLRYQDLLRKEGITPELEKKGLGQQIKEALTGKRDRTAILKEQEKKLRDLKRIVEKEVDKTIKRRTTRETRKMQITRAISMGFLGMEWFLGILCFAIEVHYEICQLFIRYYSYHYLESNAREYLVRTRLVYTTVTAFPLIILPMIIISMLITKRISTLTVLFMLLGVVGCTMYIATGAVTLASANLTWVSYSATQAFGALAITAGLVYLAHTAYEILKDKEDDID